MKFEWDQNKIRKNIERHGFDFNDTKEVFEGLKATFPDDRFDYEEDRYVTLGLLGSVVVYIAHTYRDEQIRLISMRKATVKERRIYEKKVFLGHGKD